MPRPAPRPSPDPSGRRARRAARTRSRVATCAAHRAAPDVEQGDALGMGALAGSDCSASPCARTVNGGPRARAHDRSTSSGARRPPPPTATVIVGPRQRPHRIAEASEASEWSSRSLGDGTELTGEPSAVSRGSLGGDRD